MEAALRDDRSPAISRTRDILAALPMILLSLLAIIGFGISIFRQWPAAETGHDLAPIVSELCGATFLGLQVVLVCIRRLPIARSAGPIPRLWAIAAANFGYALLLLPKAAPASVLATLSGGIVFVGVLSSMTTLFFLGRSFAILPQALKLVTNGPYRWVRHPLYICEQVSMFGVALQYARPWAILIAIVGFVFQFPRMRYEETILTETFPDYAAYAARTPQLLPRLMKRR